MDAKPVIFAALVAASAFAQNPLSGSFATRLPTDQDLPPASANCATTLTASASNSTLSLQVASSACFLVDQIVVLGTSAPYETSQVCAKPDSTHLTLCAGTRGLSGTTAASHVSGQLVSGSLSAYHINSLSAWMIDMATKLGANLVNVVPATRTVNGHALSSNVTVSASDITTGTLPDAQLPSDVLKTGDPATAAYLDLYPPSDSTNSAGFQAPGTRSTKLRLVLPSADPTAGQVLACGAPSSTLSTCSWVTPASGGTVYYQTVKAGGSAQTQRSALNLIAGSNVTVSCADNSGAGSTDCTVASTATGGGSSAKYAAAISGTSTSITAATHGLGSTVVVSGCKDGSGAALWPDWSVDGSGNVTVTSAVSQSGTCYIFGQSIYAASISGTSTSVTAATHGLGAGVIVSGCKDGSNNSLAPDWSVDGSGNVTITSAVSQSGTCYLR